MWIYLWVTYTKVWDNQSNVYYIHRLQSDHKYTKMYTPIHLGVNDLKRSLGPNLRECTIH